MKKLKKRGAESRVYKKYQLIGLEMAQLLKDGEHKALYIKLAKNGDAEKLLRLAKEIADNKNIRKGGAYFMSLLKKKS